MFFYFLKKIGSTEFRSIFSGKTAYIFKIVEEPEQLDVWIW